MAYDLLQSPRQCFPVCSARDCQTKTLNLPFQLDTTYRGSARASSCRNQIARGDITA